MLLKHPLFPRRVDQETALNVLLGHLDAIRDHGDCLSDAAADIPALAETATTTEVLDRLAAIRAFADEARRCEMILLTKVRQARHWTERLQRLDPKCPSTAGLFLGGTAALADVIARMDERDRDLFADGDQVLPFLRDRGLVDPETMSLDSVTQLGGTERLLLAGWVPVADLDALAESFTHALELHYRLIDEVADADPATPANAQPTETAEAAAASMAPAGAAPMSPERKAELDRLIADAARKSQSRSKSKSQSQSTSQAAGDDATAPCGSDRAARAALAEGAAVDEVSLGPVIKSDPADDGSDEVLDLGPALNATDDEAKDDAAPDDEATEDEAREDEAQDDAAPDVEILSASDCVADATQEAASLLGRLADVDPNEAVDATDSGAGDDPSTSDVPNGDAEQRDDDDDEDDILTLDEPLPLPGRAQRQRASLTDRLAAEASSDL